MSIARSLTKAIRQGIAYLGSCQEADGGFASLSARDERFSEGVYTFRTVFSTALILQCLNALTDDDAELKAVREGCARYLVKERGPHGAWNYWASETPEKRTMPYPDDLDDTFCAAAALCQYDPGLVPPEELAKLVTLLTVQEVEEGGPYRTWIVGPDAEPEWQDVDIAVNANIGYFLHLQDVSLPRLNRYLADHIRNSSFASPYYPSRYPIVYFLSRFCPATQQRIVRDAVQSWQRDGRWGNPLDTALAVSTLLHCGAEPGTVETAITYVRDSVQAGCPPCPLYTGVNPERDRPYVAGSAAITTAFCVLALHAFREASAAPVVAPRRLLAAAADATRMSQAAYGRVKARFRLLPSPLAATALAGTRTTESKDTDHQISLMPYYFNRSLRIVWRIEDEELLVLLGAANIHGWIAYTIFDDIMDGDAGARMIPVAATALRELTTIYERAFASSPAFLQLFHQILDGLESATYWEASECRIPLDDRGRSTGPYTIPDYADDGQLAAKSFGHALGPIAILYAGGATKDPTEVEHLMAFCRHFLIARQLNDDAHDFADDLKRGRVSSVGALLLKEWFPDGTVPVGISFRRNARRLRSIFWMDTVQKVCERIFVHTARARDALAEMGVVAEPRFLERLLEPLESSAREALTQRDTTMDFLREYRRGEPK
jgi:hypothetical protein